MAIRNAKLTRLCIGFPHIQPADHALRLTRDFVMEGWLHKTGPDVKDAWRRRWFTLDRRRLYYFDEPMVSVTVISKQKVTWLSGVQTINLVKQSLLVKPPHIQANLIYHALSVSEYTVDM